MNTPGTYFYLAKVSAASRQWTYAAGSLAQWYCQFAVRLRRDNMSRSRLAKMHGSAVTLHDRTTLPSHPSDDQSSPSLGC